MDSNFFRREENAQGELAVYEWPIETESYTIGADCSGGGARGDPAAGVVICNRDCRVVATLHEQEKPVPFGRKLARLAWTYNEALLAIETFPAGYGTMACDAAINYGYSNIYTRVDVRKLERNHTDELGWKTDRITGDRMIARVGQAITDRYQLASKELMQELWERRYDDRQTSGTPKIIGKGHDDLMDAYSIALLVRDEFWTREAAKGKPKTPRTESERFWQWVDNGISRMQGQHMRRRR